MIKRILATALGVILLVTSGILLRCKFELSHKFTPLKDFPGSNEVIEIVGANEQVWFVVVVLSIIGLGLVLLSIRKLIDS